MLSRSLLRRARSGRVPNVRPLPISLSSHPTPLVHSTSFPSIPTSFMSTSTDDFSDYDNIRQTDRIQKENGDPSKREFTYLMVGSLRFVYASAIRLGVMKFIASMSASDDVLAVANLEVPVAGIDEGTTLTVKWRGKPVFIRHRNEKEIQNAVTDDNAELKDPQNDVERRKADQAQWLVVLGICTHLGCVPISGEGEWGGWYCPCHGSHYDTSGRIRKGPAPLNLEVPDWQFIEGGEKILIG
eukprot:g1122.t1